MAGAGNAGAVETLIGSPKGLTGDGAVLWKQGAGGLVATSEKGDQFGTGVRFVDLNGDGFDDLVVGIPKEDLSVVGAGAVMVIYASPDGLVTAGAQIWHQDAAGVEGDEDPKDRMGAL